MKLVISKIIILQIVLSLFVICCLIVKSEIKAEVHRFGLIEQGLLTQAIDNDPEIKMLDRELSKAGFVRDIGNLNVGSFKAGVRIISLSSSDSSVRFIANGINLGADILNLATFGYKIHKIRKVKSQLEDRISLIKSELRDVFLRLEKTKDDVDAKNKLIGLVGEKATIDYLRWVELK